MHWWSQEEEEEDKEEAGKRLRADDDDAIVICLPHTGRVGRAGQGRAGRAGQGGRARQGKARQGRVSGWLPDEEMTKQDNDNESRQVKENSVIHDKKNKSTING